MNDLTQCPDPDTLITLLYDDEGDPDERASLEAHLCSCASCAEVYSALELTRGTLGAWQAPRSPLGFAIVDTRRSSWRRAVPWGAAAAAAVLTFAAAAGIADLDVRYDRDGLSVRTGWQRGPAEAGRVEGVQATFAVTPPTSDASVTQTAAPDSDPRTAWVTKAGAGDPPWRADFDLLAAQLRAEFDEQTRAAEARVVQAAATAVEAHRASLDEAGLLQRVSEHVDRRVASRIDQSEVRQQQNLAMRVTELGREFQLRRQADVVQFEQGLARIEQQRRDLIRRVALTQATQP